MVDGATAAAAAATWAPVVFIVVWDSVVAAAAAAAIITFHVVKCQRFREATLRTNRLLRDRWGWRLRA